MKQIIIAVLLFMTCGKAIGQTRITAGFGISQSAVGETQVSYQFKNFETGVDMIHVLNHRTYFGLNIGPSLSINDDLIVKPFAGLYYKLTGNKSSMDRYRHDGVETTFTSNLETNTGVAAVGFEYIYQHLTIKAISFFGDSKIRVGVTVGVNFLTGTN